MRAVRVASPEPESRIACFTSISSSVEEVPEADPAFWHEGRYLVDLGHVSEPDLGLLQLFFSLVHP